MAVPLIAGPVVAGALGYGISRVVARRGLGDLVGNGTEEKSLHLLSAVGASFARAINDTPKIVGVGLLALQFDGGSVVEVSNGIFIVLAAVSMAAGGLWASRQVIRTLAYRVTDLDGHCGLAANATNSGLVGVASLLGLPLSTTHVSGAALVGASHVVKDRPIRWEVVREIVNAWIITVPASAALAAAFWALAAGLSGLLL